MLKYLILSLVMLMQSCSGSSGSGAGGVGESLPTVNPEPNGNGELIYEIKPDAPVTVSASKLISSDALSPLTSVDFPLGAVSQSTEVRIFQTTSFAEQVDRSAIGVSDLSAAGPAIIVKGDDTAIKQDIFVHLPYDRNLTTRLQLLATNMTLGVITIYSSAILEILTGDQITLENNLIRVRTKRFGAFQVVKIYGGVKKQTITSPVLIENLRPVITNQEPSPITEKEPTVNSTASPEITVVSPITIPTGVSSVKKVCDNIPNGGTATRTRYHSANVASGQTCLSESQTATCNDGILGPWSGSYIFSTCSVDAAANCGDVVHGQQASRTRYQTSSVGFGGTCLSETQTTTCTNGTLGSWSGTYTFDSCTVNVAGSCGSVGHGQQASRPKYQTASVSFGQTCNSETQTTTCNNGTLGTWSGTYAFDSCTVDSPANCSDVAHGQQANRTRYQASNVAFGQTCAAESQTTTCNNGTLGSWSGTYTFDICSIAAPSDCESTPHGEQTTRIKFQASSVDFGSICISETQAATCSNGTLGTWNGTYTYNSCSVGTPLDCGSTPHGEQTTRIKFQASSVDFGSICISETQAATCSNGTLGTWNGTYTYNSCIINPPLGCGSVADGQQENRVRYQASSVPFGNLCVSETQTATCTNGTLGSWSGSYAFDVCVINQPQTLIIRINNSAAYTGSQNVTLTLTATNASQMYITNTPGCSSGGSWITYATTKAWTLGETNATSTVYAKFKDAVGNETSCVSTSIIHDGITPYQASISINGGSIYKPTTAVTLALNAVDISPMQMYITNASSCTSGGAWETYSTSKSWILAQSNVQTTVRVKFKDAVGLSSSCVYASAVVDTIPPNIPSAPSSVGTFTNTPNVTFNWTNPGDNGGSLASGVGSYNLQIGTTVNGSDIFDGNVNNLTKTITGSSGVTYYARVQAIDAVGNTSQFSSNSSGVIIDTTAPTPGSNGALTLATLTGVSATLTWTLASDTLSTQNSYQVYYSTSNDIDTLNNLLMNGTEFGSLTTDITTVTVTGLNKNTQYWFNVLVQDQAGNKAVYSTQQATTAMMTTPWTWISGSNTINELGIYGTKGTAAANNVPGAREQTTSWSDSSGNLWLFGGYGRHNNGYNFSYNDLWKFNGTQWTWVTGSSSMGQSGVYGAKGIPAATNTPGARYGAASWRDSSGNLWLFGGYGWDSSGSEWYLNDLWKYDGSQWTWVSGSNTAGQVGIYGVQGSPSANNVPGARHSAVSFIDGSNNLWLFGGYGFGNTNSGGYIIDGINDLWKFNGSQWTWIGGGNTVHQTSYTMPGARVGAASTYNTGILRLFGGKGLDNDGTYGNLNDYWAFTNNQWYLMSGTNSNVDQIGVYGTKGVPSASNVIRARASAVLWGDSFTLFGGYNGEYFNDLWSWTPQPYPNTNQWKWISGSNSVNQYGTYGTKGTPAVSNVPGARASAVGWTDSSGNYWLFGGKGYGCTGGSVGYLNDLWKFKP